MPFPFAAMRAGARRLEVRTHGDPNRASELREDWVAVEEPLEIRLAGEPLAVTMRTPGHDHELAAGFLLAEALITSALDLGTIAVCGRPGDDSYGNVIDVLPAPGTHFDLDRRGHTQRATWTNAACGVCGRQTIEDLLARCAPLEDDARFSRRAIQGLALGLRELQPTFDRTGGLHAAGIADAHGEYRVVREDIGRHNAVDKVVGRLLLDDELPASGRILIVSGRASFEIVQKALTARVSAVVSVSAPSSLAVATAARANLTLIGFARKNGFNVYAGTERLDE